ncbi:hypothetical protein ES702_04538 [subsurface metagenome]
MVLVVQYGGLQERDLLGLFVFNEIEMPTLKPVLSEGKLRNIERVQKTDSLC